MANFSSEMFIVSQSILNFISFVFKKADDRQLFYGDLVGMKNKRPTSESSYNHYEGDEYQPINGYKKPAYYEVLLPN
jgi:hypothetical protein